MNLNSTDAQESNMAICGMLAVAVALPMLFPDLPKASVVSINFVLSSLAIYSGRNLWFDQRGSERLAISTWLATSPWLFKFEAIGTGASLCCAAGLFLLAVHDLLRQEIGVRTVRIAKDSDWKRPF